MPWEPTWTTLAPSASFAAHKVRDRARRLRHRAGLGLAGNSTGIRGSHHEEEQGIFTGSARTGGIPNSCTDDTIGYRSPADFIIGGLVAESDDRRRVGIRWIDVIPLNQ